MCNLICCFNYKLDPDDSIRKSKNKSGTSVSEDTIVDKVGIVDSANAPITSVMQSESKQSDSSIRVVKKLEHGLVLFAMKPLAGKAI